VHRRRALDEQEILHEVARGHHNLRAHARVAAYEVFLAQSRDEATQRFEEKLLAQGARHFLVHHAWIALDEPPKSWEGQAPGQVAQVDVAPPIDFAGER
jgi:hypothetical protein